MWSFILTNGLNCWRQVVLIIKYDSFKTLETSSSSIKTFRWYDWTGHFNRPYVHGHSDCPVQVDCHIFPMRLYWPNQFKHPSFYGRSDWPVQFGCTAFPRRSDRPVQFYCSTFFEQYYRINQIDSSTNHEWYHWIVHLNWFLHNLDPFSIFGPIFEFWQIFSIWTNFRIHTDFQRLDQFLNSERIQELERFWIQTGFQFIISPITNN